MYLSQVNIAFQGLLVGALQAEDVAEWEMWECEVSKDIENNTSVNLAKSCICKLTKKSIMQI